MREIGDLNPMAQNLPILSGIRVNQATTTIPKLIRIVRVSGLDPNLLGGTHGLIKTAIQ